MENELEVVNIRLVKEPSLYSEQTLDSPQAVVELMAKELSQYDREVFCILNMKNNGQVINMNLVSVGTINASLVIPREVFKSSILANASAIIGLHNHPSGNVQPSKAVSYTHLQRDEDLFSRIQGSIGKSGRSIQPGIIEADTISRRDTDVYKRQVLVCVNNIEMPDAENMTVSVDAKGATENTNKDRKSVV